MFASSQKQPPGAALFEACKVGVGAVLHPDSLLAKSTKPVRQIHAGLSGMRHCASLAWKVQVPAQVPSAKCQVIVKH